MNYGIQIAVKIPSPHVEGLVPFIDPIYSPFLQILLIFLGAACMRSAQKDTVWLGRVNNIQVE